MNTNRCKMQDARCKIILFALLTLFLVAPGLARAGKVLSEDIQITTNLDDQTSPAVAYDTVNNKYLVVWTDYRDVYCNESGDPLYCNGTDIYGKICTGSPTTTTGAYGGSGTSMTCGTEFVISNATGNQAQPKVAFDDCNNKYLVVWTDSRNLTYGQIYGQFVLPDATTPSGAALSGANFAISTYTANQDINQYAPDVIFNPVTKKFVTAWVDTSTFDTSANPANSFTITGYGKYNCTTSKTYIYIPVPYVDHNLIRTIEVDAVTGTLTNKQEISQFAGIGPLTHTSGSVSQSWSVYKYAAKPKLSYSALTGENFVAFSGRNYTVTLSASYTMTYDDTTMTDTCTYSPATFTATDNDAGVTQIKIRKNDGLGLLQDLSFGFNTTKLSAISPAVSMDPNTDRMLVVWEEPSAAGTDSVHAIYGQLIDLNSFLPYCPHVIQISAGTGERTSPVAAFDNVNQRFFVAWEDARNQSTNISNMDIYGQFIDSQCTLSGANTLVSQATGNQLAPVMAFGDVNFRDFFVVWKDARVPGNSDIYGQLFEFSDAVDTTGGTGGTTATLTASPASIDFGTVSRGSKSAAQTVTISNNSGTSQTITTLTKPGSPFNVSSSTCSSGSILANGASCVLNIVFNPTAKGKFIKNITLTTPNLSVPLSGTGG